MKDDRILVTHIFNEIQFLKTITKGRNYDDLLSDQYYSHAVIRAIEVIGEASKNLSPRIKEEHPGIAWREIAGMRDKVIHRYFEINWQIVWSVLSDDLLVLETEFSALLKEIS